MNLQDLTTKEIEQSTIGHLIINGNKPEVISKLPEIQDDYFFDPKLQKIFRAIKNIIHEGGEINPVNIREKTKYKATDLTEPMQLYCHNLDYNIRMLKKYADTRWLVQKLHGTLKEVEDRKDIDQLMSNISMDVVARIRKLEPEKTKIKDLMEDFEDTEAQNKEAAKSSGVIGIPFGYDCLDRVISGIRAPHYITIKAKTNVGKTAFLLNILSNVLNEGKRAVLFSLEMSKFQNIARILGIRTNITPLEIEKGSFLGEDIENKHKDILYNQDLTIYENKLSINQILTAIKAEQANQPIDVVFLDYIQNIAIDDTRYESYTAASQKLQAISKELNIPIVAASQINKEGDARGSGDIDNHANLIAKLDPGDNVEERELYVEKNRHGPKNKSRLVFDQGGGLSELK